MKENTTNSSNDVSRNKKNMQEATIKRVTAGEMEELWKGFKANCLLFKANEKLKEAAGAPLEVAHNETLSYDIKVLLEALKNSATMEVKPKLIPEKDRKKIKAQIKQLAKSENIDTEKNRED